MYDQEFVYICHVLIDPEPDNVPVQLLSQKLIDSKIARHHVLINETNCPVYFDELFVIVQEGVSNVQVELHQSEFVLLLSSHCSVHSVDQFQQTAQVAAVVSTTHIWIQVTHQEYGLYQIIEGVNIQIEL